jgi:hypothetical protein
MTMQSSAVNLIIIAKTKAGQGVDFSPQHGALCPCCSLRTKVYKTMPWEGDIRIRYHHCRNRSCLLQQINVSVKSLEQDLTGVTLPE